ncbi:MAG: chorismate mutase [Candidatus Eremiobacteraeota bacterium]|nr:chorismate mutase [Candidatus Eremiobacteraeota bacterium]
MAVRGIRGAITAAANTQAAIVSASERLLVAMVEANGVRAPDIAAVLFTTTMDLDAEFPAAAARGLGWDKVPLLCGHEMDVPGRLAQCIRILMLVNSDATQAAIKHIYLEGATALRPDLAGEDSPHTAGSTF